MPTSKDLTGGSGDDKSTQHEGDDRKRKRDESVAASLLAGPVSPGMGRDKSLGTDGNHGNTLTTPATGKDTQPNSKKPSETPQVPTKRLELAKMTHNTDISSIVAAQEPVTRSLIPDHIEHGVLIPLKTTLELRDDHQCGQVLITRSPIRSTSAVIGLLRDLLPEEIVKGMPHLRRCAKPADLPAHLKSQFMNDTAISKQIHTGKSNWVYVLLGLEATLSREEMATALSKVDGFDEGVFIASIPVPLLAPTSQIQAALWTSQFWPTMYRKNNPLGPHPSLVIRATDEIAADAPIWMALAHDVALKAKKAGYGEAMGACIVLRRSDGPQLVAVAGDGRWQRQHRSSKTGNPMAHAVLRAVSMVAQKLVRAEKKNQQRKRSVASTEERREVGNENTALASAVATTATPPPPPTTTCKSDCAPEKGNGGQPSAAQSETEDQPLSQVHNEVQDRVRDRLSRNRDRGHAGNRQRLAFEAFQDKPMLDEEVRIFAQEHPTPDGYLCHGLELYVTHEPCAMCSMAILHSRMGKVIFANRMPLTGGLSAEDRVLTPGRQGSSGGGSSNAGPGKGRERPDLPSGEGIHGLGLFWRRELNWSLLAWEWEAHCCCPPLDMNPATHA